MEETGQYHMERLCSVLNALQIEEYQGIVMIFMFMIFRTNGKLLLKDFPGCCLSSLI